MVQKGERCPQCKRLAPHGKSWGLTPETWLATAELRLRFGSILGHDRERKRRDVSERSATSRRLPGNPGYLSRESSRPRRARGHPDCATRGKLVTNRGQKPAMIKYPRIVADRSGPMLLIEPRIHHGYWLHFIQFPDPLQLVTFSTIARRITLGLIHLNAGVLSMVVWIFDAVIE